METMVVDLGSLTGSIVAVAVRNVCIHHAIEFFFVKQDVEAFVLKFLIFKSGGFVGIFTNESY